MLYTLFQLDKCDHLVASIHFIKKKSFKTENRLTYAFTKAFMSSKSLSNCLLEKIPSQNISVEVVNSKEFT